MPDSPCLSWSLCVLWFTVFFPCYPILKSYDKAKNSIKRRANDPKPLPRRRRRLSTSSYNTSNFDSPLLGRLPIELRLEIYGYVLGGELFHIFPAPKRMAHYYCPSPSWNDTNCKNCLKTTRSPLPLVGNGRIPNNDIALLKACRQIYNEASHVLYATNVFELGNLNSFLHFSQTIRPCRLASIARLHICWDLPTRSKEVKSWKRGWHTIATQMSALVHLKLMLGCSLKSNLISGWIHPILEVQGLKSFSLQFKPDIVEALRIRDIDLVEGTEPLRLFLQKCLCTEIQAEATRSS